MIIWTSWEDKKPCNCSFSIFCLLALFVCKKIYSRVFCLKALLLPHCETFWEMTHHNEQFWRICVWKPHKAPKNRRLHVCLCVFCFLGVNRVCVPTKNRKIPIRHIILSYYYILCVCVGCELIRIYLMWLRNKLEHWNF